MKVLGQLETAQLEQISSSGGEPTPTPTGRIYIDIASPLVAKPKVYDGSGWREFQLKQSSPYVSQNSGKAVTINWANGLNQKVILTDNCVISFSNPQAGLTHRLLVIQNNATSLGDGNVFRHTFNMIDQGVQRGNYQPVWNLPLGNTKAYTWLYEAAFQAGWATIPSATFNPLTAPLAAVTGGIDISPDGNMLVAGGATTPFASFYGLTNGTYTQQSSFGVRNYVTPTAAVAALVGSAFSPDGKLIFFASGTTPYIQGYMFGYNNYGMNTTVLANPATLPAGAGQSIAVSPNGNFVGIGHTTTPFFSIYPISGNAYSAKISNPSTLPAAQVTSLAWSPQGDYLAAASRTTPFLQVWAFAGSTPGSSGFGAAAANPASLPVDGPVGQTGKGVAWRPQGDYIALAMATTPYLYVVPFDRATGTFGAALSVTGSAIAAQINAVQWTPDGQYLVCACNASPGLYVFDFSAATIGAGVAFDGSSPGVRVNDLVIHPNGEVAFLGLNSAQITQQTLPRKVKNYLRLND